MEQIELRNPSLCEIIRASEDLCYKLKVSYDTRKIFVTTDYGTKVVIYYDDSNEENS